jgi:hypothetical protein
MANQSPSDPLKAFERLVRQANRESVPEINSMPGVMRNIRQRTSVFQEKPLMWMTAGSAIAAVAVLIFAFPAASSLMDPLATFLQDNPMSMF